MSQIENIQDEQKKTAEMIAAARKLQNEAKTGDKCTTMPEEMKSFFKERQGIQTLTAVATAR